MYIMEHSGEGQRMVKRDIEEIDTHLALAGIRSGDDVLDVGCASGLLTMRMAALTDPGQAVGLDLSGTRLEMARGTATRAEVSNLAYVEGDVCAIPFDDDHFDVAFSRFTFEYLREPHRALKEMKRVTRPGGRVVVMDLDGNGVFHYPIPPEVEQTLNQLTRALAKVGFDPFIGRKLYSMFHQEGFRRIEVQAMPHHLIAGKASPYHMENWETKLRTIRPQAKKAFSSDAQYDGFVDTCLSLLGREDVLTYSTTFIVIGTV